MNEIISRSYSDSSDDYSNEHGAEEFENNLNNIAERNIINNQNEFSSSSSSEQNSNQMSPNDINQKILWNLKSCSRNPGGFLNRFSVIERSSFFLSNLKKTLNSQHIGMRYYDPKSFELYPELAEYKQYQLTELQAIKRRFMLYIKYIDFFLAVMDIITIFLGFEFCKHQVDTSIPTKEIKNCNYLKVSIALSVFSIVLIALRAGIYIKARRVMYLVNILFIFSKEPIALTLLFEIITHLFMPYAFFADVKWRYHINEDYFYLYFNVILYILSSMRIYTVIRFCKMISSYSTPRSRRLLSYFNITDEYRFIFKAMVRSNNLIFFIITLLYLIFTGAMYVTLFERSTIINERNKDSVEYYSLFINCLTSIALYMITIGFGNKSFMNPITKVFIGILSTIGLFIITLIVLRLITFLKLDPEELKCYKIIELIRNKGRNGFIKKYMDNYIKYKMLKLRKKSFIADVVREKNNFSVYKNHNYVKVRDALTEKFEIEDFSKAFHIKEKQVFTENSNFVNHLCIMEDQVSDLLSSNDKINTKSKKITTKFNKIINLGKLIASVDSFAHLEGVDTIKGKHIIKSKDIKRSVREFQVKYKNRNPKGNEIIMQNAIYQNEESTDENLSDINSLNSSYKDD